MESEDLLLLQIGPVQEFITAARTTGDLWSGSYLIAYLTAAGIKYVKDNGGEIIFPCLDDQMVYKRLCDETNELGQPTLPNRFLAEVPSNRASDIAKGADNAIRMELAKISNACFKKFCDLFSSSGKKYEARWNDQVSRFLQISWQTVPLDSQNWVGSYSELLANLAARRNTRNFEQFRNDDPALELQKDPLNGKDEIVGDLEEWKSSNKFFTRGSTEESTGDRPYGALSIIKRIWDECYLNNKEDKDKYSAYNLKNKTNGEAAEYIAAIQMDGDHMGAILSAQDKDNKFFTNFSKKLANFTRDKAGKIVADYSGKLIYAGGDDVLAVLPACNAVACARKLREVFCSDRDDMPGSEKNLAKDVPRVSLSAGIAFAHWKTPLAWLLEEARNAEHRAKNEYQRDALALSIVKRGGEILQWGAKFDSPAWNLYDKFIELDKAKKVSGKFASALALFLRPYLMEATKDKDLEIISEIIKKDFELVCSRQKAEKVVLPSEFTELAHKYIDSLKEAKQLAEFPLLFLSASFLTRKKENNNEKGK